jgi:hypothetical protein
MSVNKSKLAATFPCKCGILLHFRIKKVYLNIPKFILAFAYNNSFNFIPSCSGCDCVAAKFVCQSNKS